MILTSFFLACADRSGAHPMSGDLVLMRRILALALFAGTAACGGGTTTPPLHLAVRDAHPRRRDAHARPAQPVRRRLRHAAAELRRLVRLRREGAARALAQPQGDQREPTGPERAVLHATGIGGLTCNTRFEDNPERVPCDHYMSGISLTSRPGPNWFKEVSGHAPALRRPGRHGRDGLLQPEGHQPVPARRRRSPASTWPAAGRLARHLRALHPGRGRLRRDPQLACRPVPHRGLPAVAVPPWSRAPPGSGPPPRCPAAPVPRYNRDKSPRRTGAVQGRAVGGRPVMARARELTVNLCLAGGAMLAALLLAEGSLRAVGFRPERHQTRIRLTTADDIRTRAEHARARLLPERSRPRVRRRPRRRGDAPALRGARRARPHAREGLPARARVPLQLARLPRAGAAAARCLACAGWRWSATRSPRDRARASRARTPPSCSAC